MDGRELVKFLDVELKRRGIPKDAKDAQVLLGHASITITQDIYTELESKHREAVTSVIQDYIAKNKVLSEPLSKPVEPHESTV